MFHTTKNLTKDSRTMHHFTKNLALLAGVDRT
jgi:hypothetical protein